MDFQADKLFGTKLRAIRRAQDLTQEQFSAQLQVLGVDMTRGTFAKIESGKRHVYLGELLAIQKVLKVPFSELLDL